MTKPWPYRRLTATEALPAERAGLGSLRDEGARVAVGQDSAVTVRHVHQAFPRACLHDVDDHLDRLYRKGVLVRRRRGRAFAYESRCSRDELLGELVSGHVTDLLAASSASGAFFRRWSTRSVGRTPRSDELDSRPAERGATQNGGHVSFVVMLWPGTGRRVRTTSRCFSIRVGRHLACGPRPMRSTSNDLRSQCACCPRGSALLTLAVALCERASTRVRKRSDRPCCTVALVRPAPGSCEAGLGVRAGRPCPAETVAARASDAERSLTSRPIVASPEVAAQSVAASTSSVACARRSFGRPCARRRACLDRDNLKLFLLVVSPDAASLATLRSLLARLAERRRARGEWPRWR